MNIGQPHIGIDMAKEKFDAFIPSQKDPATGKRLQFKNDLKGYKAIRDVARRIDAIVCVEPTAGYEAGLVAYMHKSGVRVVYTDPSRVRNFAKAEGLHAKNDKIDAELISRFARTMGVRILSEHEFSQVELHRMHQTKMAFVATRTNLISRLDTESSDEMSKLLQREISHLDKVIARLVQKCNELVASDERSGKLSSRMKEVRGISDSTTVALLGGLPELGQLPDKKLFMLCGIAPVQKQSGSKEWIRKIHGGRSDVRAALYMAATACLLWNSRLKAYYDKKRSEGHPHKWAMVPVMRKVLVILNHIARGEAYKPLPESEEFTLRMVNKLKQGWAKRNMA